MFENRKIILSDFRFESGPVIYWMSRDYRIFDNWSLAYAQDLAIKMKQPLIVCIAYDEKGKDISQNQFDFFVSGIVDIQNRLGDFNIPLVFKSGSAKESIVNLANELKASCIVTDFESINTKRNIQSQVEKSISIPIHIMDSHNIVPCVIASPKQEWAAYTIRKKIHKQLNNFLYEFPQIIKHPFTLNTELSSDIFPQINLRSFAIESGEKYAHSQLKSFIDNKLEKYHELRNNPDSDMQSDLSPYLHFGQIASQRAVVEVMNSNACEESKNAFIEEILVRKELSENFCYYNNNYDNFEGFDNWAKDTLNKHRGDRREYVYSLEEFENARTHDNLWNAGQNQMVNTGKMHGYVRMYWAKKILEWTENPETALEYAIYLNDKYSLDGIDSNGYTGIAWSIGGIHDRPWFERNIFGKIRYMSYNSQIKKVKMKDYILKYAHQK